MGVPIDILTGDPLVKSVMLNQIYGVDVDVLIGGVRVSEGDSASLPNQETAKKYPGLVGQPGEVIKDGYKETLIGPDGRAEKQRHNTDHNQPKQHTNPHDHDISWRPDNTPDFSKHINYPNGNVPTLN